MRTLAGMLAVVAAALALAACGSDSSKPDRPVDGGPSGRPIGVDQGAEGQVIDAALNFSRGYLRQQRGQLPAQRIPAATKLLRDSLDGQRIPLASQDRRKTVIGAIVNSITGTGARVTVTVRNITESFTYPMLLDLVKRDGEWLVTSVPDDL